MRRAVQRVLVAGAVCALPLAATAQTDQAVFGGWRANPLTVGSRAAGMGGAFVAVADDARAAFVNPAGLTQIPVFEISASSGRPWVSAAGGHQRLRAAVYFTKAEHEPLAETDDTPIGLQPSVWEVGAGLGVQPFRRVRLGAAVAYRHLGIEEEGRRPANGSQPVDALVGREDAQVRFSVGTLIDLLPAPVVGASPLKLGVSFQPGVSFDVPRPGGAPVEIRRPSVSEVGLSWRTSSAWSFTGQADIIRYHEVVDTLRRNVGEVAGRDFLLSSAIEPRLGTEFATPLRCGCGTVKLRAGLHYESPGTLRYDGPDPELRDAFRTRSWRTTVTMGASLFAEHFGNAIRFDVDSLDLLEGPALSFGIVWRF